MDEELRQMILESAAKACVLMPKLDLAQREELARHYNDGRLESVIVEALSRAAGQRAHSGQGTPRDYGQDRLTYS